tara:strand:+ start:1477 stop:2478 length:1002 start_codon:yes stop_codon:yes gene_type:complete
MKWLFVGNFQSKKRGSYTVSEQIVDYLNSIGEECKLVSTASSKILRIIQYLFYAFFSKRDQIHIDVFSGKPFLIAYYMALIFKFRDKKVNATLHGGMLIDYLKHKKYFKKLDVFNNLLTPSLKMSEYLNRKNIFTLYQPNPINISRFPFSPSRKPQKKIKLLWVRAFMKVYNPIVPVKLVALMLEKGFQVELTMIGPDGGLLKEINKFIKKEKLESHINILGKIKNENLSKYFMTHNVFLTTSNYESFGMSILEAALSGIAIVAFPTGEIPYIWKESEISFTDNITYESYYEALVILLKSKDWLGRLDRARKVAEQFDKDIILKKWVNRIKSF